MGGPFVRARVRAWLLWTRPELALRRGVEHASQLVAERRGAAGFLHPLPPLPLWDAAASNNAPPSPICVLWSSGFNSVAKFQFSRLCNSNWRKISGLYRLNVVGRDFSAVQSGPVGSSGRWEGGEVGKGQEWLLEGLYF